MFKAYFSLMKVPPISIWQWYKLPAKPETPRIIHAVLIKMGFEENEDEGALMIMLYGKVGDVHSYCSVFASLGDKSPCPVWSDGVQRYRDALEVSRMGEVTT